VARYTNITSNNVPVVLATRGDNLSNITSILITNTHDTTTADIDLYIQDSSNNTFHIIKNTLIPAGVSLALTDNVKFNNTSSGYSLIINAIAGTVDVHIKQN
tara:strand:- start:14 stop:319 length:306 start_codon:yes stop_codon:yes gene_type:complete